MGAHSRATKIRCMQSLATSIIPTVISKARTDSDFEQSVSNDKQELWTTFLAMPARGSVNVSKT
jgi:hypothetical protein